MQPIQLCPVCDASPEEWEIQLDVPIFVPFHRWDNGYPCHNEPEMRTVSIYNAYDNRVVVCSSCDTVLKEVD